MQIALQHGPLRAAAETHGGELVSLQADGLEYIWGGDPAYWTGRNPILFPIVGGLKDGTVRIQGKPFHMGRHGFARDQEFTVQEQGEDFVAFALRENEASMEKYPYPFLLQVRHQLLDDGFSTEFQIENPGENPMPFCIGAHTAFRCPLAEGEAFTDYQLVFEQAEEGDSLLLDAAGLMQPGKKERFLSNEKTLSLDYAVFKRLDTLIFEGLHSKSVSLLPKGTGRGVRLHFEGFPMVAFWTKPGAPFLCLEPWHGCTALEDESGDFTDKPHCITLSPGEKKSLRYRVELVRGT